MPESLTVENKRQRRQKPPLSLGRIAGEVLVGAVAGLAVALPLTLLIGRAIVEKDVCFEELAIFMIFAISFPILYGLVAATGIYLVGTRGKETGSFLMTSAGGVVGGCFMFVMLPLALFLSNAQIAGVENIIVCTIGAFMLLSPPVFGTVGFNLTRRYRKELKEDVDRKSNNLEE